MSKISDFSTIPLFDLNHISSLPLAQRKAEVKKFGEALIEVGFLAIKVPHLADIVQKVNRIMADYFHQSSTHKMEDWRDNSGQEGYSEMGRESAAGAYKADIKETYFISPQCDIWPSRLPEFKTIMHEYHQLLSEESKKVFTFFYEFLGEDVSEVPQSVVSAKNLIRLAYYPRPQKEHEVGAVWAAAHTDLNAFTLLPPSSTPGLQLLTKQGDWMDVEVPAGHMIVNTGDQIEKKTAGLIKATPHQVINKGGDYASRERFASIFFSTWSSNFSLAPFTSCIKEGVTNLNQFPDVTVEENLLARLIELKTIKSPDINLLRHLRSKGLIQQPPEHLKEFL